MRALCVTADLPFPREDVYDLLALEIEAIAAQPPSKVVERNISADGRRIAEVTYTLRVLPGDWTQIRVEYAAQKAPLGERLASPLIWPLTRRRGQRALRQLAGQLGARTRISETATRPANPGSERVSLIGV